MPLLLSSRASTSSPLPLLTSSEARLRGVRHRGSDWLRVRTGVYVDRSAYQKLSPSERYAVRVHAFLRTHPDAILCFESAGVIHGLPTFGETEHIHVYDPSRARSRRFSDVCVHTSEDSRQVERVDGTLVTSLLDTVVDLARVLPPARAVAVADSVVSPVQGGTLQLDELRLRTGEQVNRRGRRRASWTWDHTVPLSESPAESVSRLVIAWNGFETPALQQVFRYEGHEDRTDFYFPSSRVIGECDGWQKYALGEPEKAAKLLADEKRREDQLRRHRHPFARWDLRDAWKSAPVREALLAAGAELVRPPETGMLRTLAIRSREKPFRALDTTPGAMSRRRNDDSPPK
ncbi:MAG: hypothetical protein JF592_14310 [Microbacterium sp.]|uniref:hypothetical protein n=1 Tax=Microbacterium sp. TaxID=51671 RepID=UPI001D977908|nr:hypothetical protein [Microbacterium sp.]MBW8763733.1 hypothetical protein [Microbacterium sp.]